MSTVKFLFKDGKRKALTMSYDDGMIYDRRLVELFNKYGIKGSFHLNAGIFGNERNVERLPASEVKDLYEGHEVSCHGYTHPFFERIPHMEMVREILRDKKELEELCGYVVRGMSYPMGTYNSEVAELLRNLGMNYSRTTISTGNFKLPDDFMLWNPTCHHNDSNLMNHIKNLKNYNYDLGLLYVWGHSYEFERNNNWEIIEDFCREASYDEDIWYATNIQIYDYVTAMRKCELSVNGDMMYNPSAVSVFVKVNDKVIECKGGLCTKLL